MYYSEEQETAERFLVAICKIRSLIFDGSPAESSGLTPALAKALLAIVDHKPQALRVRELAETLDIKESSASVLAERLVLSGFAEKKHLVGDGRVLLVEPTAAGNRLAIDLRTHRLAKATEALSRLQKGEPEALVAQLEHVYTAGVRI
jgi:DNA-binding MarR family transcriptional regulator